MSARLTLVCHASTRAVREAAFPLDEPLDSRGLAQASVLAGSLGGTDAVWTSPAIRAKQTAAALRLDAAVETALADIDLGRWAGRPFAKVLAEEPDSVAAWTSETDAAPHGGESITHLLERVTRWLDTVGRNERRIVAVTHPAVIRAAIIVAIGAKPASFWRIDAAPLCRVMLRGSGSRWRLHLP
jgi:broad specificity phosphatase PhoE